eukprot:jgi/Orpsp1_1/1185785/evm.model.c7180000095229.1
MALLWASTKENFKSFIETFVQMAMRLMGVFLMFLVVILFSIALFAYFSTLLPSELDYFFGTEPKVSRTVFATIQSICSIYLVILILFNYYECLITDPGTVDKQQYLRWKKIDNYLKNQQNKNQQSNQESNEEIIEVQCSSSSNIPTEQDNVVIDIDKDEKQQLLNDEDNFDENFDIDACMEELGDFPDYSNMFVCKK